MALGCFKHTTKRHLKRVIWSTFIMQTPFKTNKKITLHKRFYLNKCFVDKINVRVLRSRLNSWGFSSVSLYKSTEKNRVAFLRGCYGYSQGDISQVAIIKNAISSDPHWSHDAFKASLATFTKNSQGLGLGFTAQTSMDTTKQ